MTDLINNRRTIRKYSNKEVSEELICSLLEASGRASTNGNMQLYSVVITRDEEKKKLLAPAHFSQPAFVGAPLSLTFCADFHRFNLWCKECNADPGYDNELSFLTAMTDTLLVAQTFAMLAESKGLGICYLGTAMYNAKQISEVLELPHNVVPVTTITVGYPAEAPEQQDRINPSAWIHKETYRDFTPTDIHSIYDYKDEMEINKKFVKENEKETLAQVFTDVRYNKANNEYFSKQYMDLLGEKGFLFATELKNNK